eukprot:jgi/Tetstr1/430582/TSEL_020379.t1
MEYNKYDRECSKLPLSFKNLNRKVRNALVNHHIEMSGKRCVDIDVANCHPKVFLQLLEKRGVPSDRDLVVKYVNERKRILEEVQTVYSCSRDTAKSLLLALINFGTVKSEMLDAMMLAWHVVDMIGHKVIRAGDQYYGYSGSTNMSSGSVNEIVAQQLVHEDNLIFIGVSPVKGKEITRNLRCSSHMKVAIPYVPPYIPLNNDFLVTTGAKIPEY